MFWGYMPKLETAPHTGLEIWNRIIIFAYNCWTVCQKILILVSMDRLSWRIQEYWLSTIRNFHELRYLLNDLTLAQISIGITISMSWRYLRRLNTAPPSIPEMQKRLTFENTSKWVCILCDITFLGLCRFRFCLVYYFTTMWLATILKQINFFFFAATPTNFVKLLSIIVSYDLWTKPQKWPDFFFKNSEIYPDCVLLSYVS